VAAGDAAALPGRSGLLFQVNMGWMHDTLAYFSRDPIYRKYHQNDLTFATLYQHTENFILPFSHDEVVHGKGSLAGKMPGDDWQKFANLRAMLAYQWLFPGKKLLMMGSELGQTSEWNANASVDWALLEQGPYHCACGNWCATSISCISASPALFEGDYDTAGFFWLDCADAEHSVLSFIRQTPEGGGRVAVILNLTPQVHAGYRIGLPAGGPLAGGAEYRRANLRREQPGEPGRRDRGGATVAPPTLLRRSQAAAAGGGGAAG